MSAIEVHRALDRARELHHEDKDGAEAEAIRCHEIARTLDDAALRCRALVLQAAIALQRGDLHGAVELITEAEPHRARRRRGAQRAGRRQGTAQLLRRLLRRVARAGRAGDRARRPGSARSSCAVRAPPGVRGVRQHRRQRLARAAPRGARSWRSRPATRGRRRCRATTSPTHDGAGRPRGRRGARSGGAMAIAAPLAPRNRFALAVLGCTRSEVRLRAGRAGEALDDAQRSIELLTRSGDPNPYLLAMTVVVEVQALLALGRLDEAESSGAACGRAARRARPAGAQHDPQHGRRRAPRGRPRPRGLPRPRAERRGRAGRLPGALRAAARARARDARDPSRRAARATRWPPRTASSSRSCASSTRRGPRSSSRPTATT